MPEKTTKTEEIVAEKSSPKKKLTSKSDATMKIPKNAHYGTGKRKSAIAKVWLFEGKGDTQINKKTLMAHFGSEMLIEHIIQPLRLMGLESKYNVVISSLGGGLVGQADAALLGIARALLVMNPEFRSKLREQGFLTRDPRVKERKKYGKRGARKSPQYRKR